MGSRELRILAGDRAFERGVSYFEEGRVIEMTTRDGRTTAMVEGSEIYKVNLRETTRSLEGSCTCPASDGFDFCKHCVAVGLALAARQAELDKLTSGSPDDRIRGYLSQQSSESLIEIILSSLPDLPNQRDRLSLQADIATGRVDARTLKKRITAATPLRHIWQHRQVARYFTHLENVFESITAIAADLPPDVLLATAMHGINRLDLALERVDDSNGYRWGAQQALRELYCEALSRLEWPAERKAENLLDLVLADPWDQFSEDVEHYQDALGAEGLAAFYSTARIRLDALPELAFGASFEEKLPYLRLTRLLEDKAEREGDTDTLLELARRTCTSPHDCYGIAELYLGNEQLENALAWLDRADGYAKPREPHHALRVKIQLARREWGEALAAQHKVFAADPSQAQYAVLMDIAAEEGRASEAATTARAYLREQVNSQPWAETAAATLASLLRADGSESEAYQLIHDHIRDPGLLLQYSKWYGDQPGRACELIMAAVERHIGYKDRRSYAEACRILEGARAVFDALSPDAFNESVADIRRRHAAKRNLVALLDKL